MAGLLDHFPTVLQDRGLALHLKAHGLLDGLQGVDVLRLGAGAEFFLANRAQGHVGVATHAALVHARVGDAEGLDQLAQCADVGLGHLGCALAGADDRLGHDLDQGDARAVAVHQRRGGAGDAAGGGA